MAKEHTELTSFPIKNGGKTVDARAAHLADIRSRMVPSDRNCVALTAKPVDAPADPDLLGEGEEYGVTGEWLGTVDGPADENVASMIAGLCELRRVTKDKSNVAKLYDRVIATLRAVSDGGDHAGLVERLLARKKQTLPSDWKQGRECPECGSDATRPKCFYEMGPSCPRHNPDEYEPSPYVEQADQLCVEAATAITAQAAENAALRERVKALHETLQEASDHLDYCGYGDAWERECAEGLPAKIAEILKAEALK